MYVPLTVTVHRDFWDWLVIVSTVFALAIAVSAIVIAIKQTGLSCGNGS